MSYKLKVGTRRQVFNGTAEKTSGGLRKEDLMMKNGRIVSRRASRAATKNYRKKLKNNPKAKCFQDFLKNKRGKIPKRGTREYKEIIKNCHQ